MNDPVRIWSFEHRAWWKPQSMGYTKWKADAGLYERVEAEKIVSDANFVGGSINEVVVNLNGEMEFEVNLDSDTSPDTSQPQPGQQ